MLIKNIADLLNPYPVKFEKMSPTTAIEIPQNGSVKSHEMAGGTASKNEDFDILKLLDKPRPINIERKCSFDGKSLSEFSNGLSPHQFSRNTSTEYSLRAIDYIDQHSNNSPCRKSSMNTPRSNSYYETHPMVGDAWEALRRSLVCFRGQPVGTIAALDHSVEGLNYDQVTIVYVKHIIKFESFLSNPVTGRSLLEILSQVHWPF